MEVNEGTLLVDIVVVVMLDMYVIMFGLHIIMSCLDSFIFWFS